jgi:hypothetical protein
MKKYLLFIVVFLMAAWLNAQPPGRDRMPKPEQMEKIKALYVAFITQKINLTTEEAQKFWPVHTQYDNELMEINKSGLQELDREEAVLKVKRKYAASFTKILGTERYNQFNIHDSAFREKIKARLREMKMKRKQNGNKPFKEEN